MTTPVDTVRRLYDAFGRGDVPAVLLLLDAQVEWTEAERFPYYGGTWRGPQAVLDNLLKNGPAHYINSAELGQTGNLIIFAHSSHLPIVTNKMFQAFNNIPNLNAGDSITVVGSDGKDYLYSVVSVVKADANGATIDTSTDHGTNLTLVTCDTLTGVSARFVLTATFIGVSNATAGQ